MQEFKVRGIVVTHEDLKPCPFCGEKPKLEWKQIDRPVTFFGSYFVVRCTNPSCRCIVETYKHDIGTMPEFDVYGSMVAIQSAVSEWNHRAEKEDKNA